MNGQRLSMDTYIDFPIKNREDFKKLKERYNPQSSERYPDKLQDFKTRTMPLVCPGSIGLYMQLRYWMGIENLSLA